MSKLHQQILVSLSLTGVSLGQIFAIQLLSQQGKAVASTVSQNLVPTFVAQEVGTTDGSKSSSQQHLLAQTNPVSSPNSLPSQKSTQVSQSQSQSWESGVQTSFVPPRPPIIPAPVWLSPFLNLFLNQQPTAADPLAATIPPDKPVYKKENTLKNEGKAKLARGQGDERGCFAAYLNNTDRSARERAFINALTGRPDEFVVISKSREIALFDGRRPGTNEVLELKDPRDETRNYVKSLTQEQLNRWDQQRARELRVADACGYKLIGITSNPYFANFLNRRWKGRPPYYYIKAPNIQGLTPPPPPPPDNPPPPEDPSYYSCHDPRSDTYPCLN